MYDVRKPLLVFVTQTHHPVLEHHTGYLFAEYDFTYLKPRELFFQHIYEAHLYALHTGADMEMDPERKPEIVTALAYILSAEDDSRFGSSSAHYGEGRTEAQAHKYRRGKGPMKDTEVGASELQQLEGEEEAGLGLGADLSADFWAEDKSPDEGEVGYIDYFGD